MKRRVSGEGGNGDGGSGIEGDYVETARRKVVWCRGRDSNPHDREVTAF